MFLQYYVTESATGNRVNIEIDAATQADLDIVFSPYPMKRCHGWTNCFQPANASVWIITTLPKKTVSLWKLSLERTMV